MSWPGTASKEAAPLAGWPGTATAKVDLAAGSIVTPTPPPVPTPTTIPQPTSLVASWYAEDLTGADNSAITSWTDRVGGAVATVASGTPRLRLNRENGKSSVKFDGASWFTAGQPTALMNALSSGTYTVMIVARALGTSNTGALVSCNGGGGLYLYADGTKMGQFQQGELPFTTAQGAALFSMGYRGNLTADFYQRSIINGCAVTGDLRFPRNPSGADFLIGGNAPVNAEILEVHVWKKEFTHTDDLQFKKYECDKYAKPYPWATTGLYVLSGDSITQAASGTFDDVAYTTGPVMAQNLGLTYGQWINAATSAITIPKLLAKDTVALAGLPAMAGAPCRIHEFEWVNTKSDPSGSAELQRQICQLYRSQGFAKVILGTTLDYGGRGAEKAAYVAALQALPNGTYDRLNRLDLDPNMGVDGTAPNQGAPANTYFFDSTSHPNGKAGYPATQSGYPYLAGLISAAFQAVA